MNTNPSLVSTARKTLIDLSQHQMPLIISQALIALKNLLSEDIRSETKYQSNLDKLYNIIETIHESITTYKSSYKVDIYKQIHTFIVSYFKRIQQTKMDIIKQYKTQLSVLMKIYIYTSHIHFFDVLNDILSLFPPGTIPDRLLIEILVEIGQLHPLLFAEYSQSIISRILPLLGTITKEIQRKNISTLLSQISEAIITSLESKDASLNNNNMKFDIHPVSHLISTAYDMIHAQWLSNNSSNNYSGQGQHTQQINNSVIMNQILIRKAIIMLGTILPENQCANNANEICEMFINGILLPNGNTTYYNENFILAKAFRIYLDVNLKKLNPRINDNIKDKLFSYLSNILSDVNISPNSKSYTDEFTSLQTQIYRILHLLFETNLERSITYFVSRLNSYDQLDKLSSVYILKSVLIRINTLTHNQTTTIISSLSKLIYDNDIELKWGLFDLIYVLIDKHVLTKQNNINHFIAYIIKEGSYSDTAITNNKAKATVNDYFVTTLTNIRNKAESILVDIVNKVQHSCEVFIPQLFEMMVSSYLLYEEHDYCYYTLCLVLNTLFSKYTINEMLKQLQSNNVANYSYKLLIRMMIILAEPNKREGFINIALLSMKHIYDMIKVALHKDNTTKTESSEIDINTVELYYTKYKQSLSYIEYHNILITCIWDKIVTKLKPVDSFIQNEINDILHKYSNYNNSTTNLIAIPILLRMKGTVLSKLPHYSKETLQAELDDMFHIVHLNYRNCKFDLNIQTEDTINNVYHSALAEAFGLCCKGNSDPSVLDTVLNKINAIFKSEVVSKQVSGFAAIFAIGRSKEEIGKEAIKSLIEIIGVIAKYAYKDFISSRINSNFLSYLDEYYNNNKHYNKNEIKQVVLKSYGNVFHSLEKLSTIYTDNKGEIYYLKKRDDYLKLMHKEITTCNSVDIKHEAIYNIASLIKLDPPITLEQCLEYITLAFNIMFNTVNNSSEYMLIEQSVLILESIIIHDKHCLSNKNNNNTPNNTSVRVIPNEYMIDYNSIEEMHQWDMFSYICEQFVKNYLRLTNDIEMNRDNSNEVNNNSNRIVVKSHVVYALIAFVKAKKSVKVNNINELRSWCVSVICVLYFVFDETNTDIVDKQELFLLVVRMLTGIEVYDNVDYTNQDSFIISLTKAIKTKLPNEMYIFFTKMVLALITTQQASISDYASTLQSTLILNAVDVFQQPTSSSNNNEQDEQLTTTTTTQMIAQFVNDIINKLNEIIQIDQTESSYKINNLLHTISTLSTINLNVILDALFTYNHGNAAFPLPLRLITQCLCDDKTKIANTFAKITDIINNSDPGAHDHPNQIICRSTVILGTMLETQNPNIQSLIEKALSQLLCTLLLRIGSAHSITTPSTVPKEEDPRNQAIWALQQLMLYYKQPELTGCIDSTGSIAKKLLSSSEYDEGIYELLTIFCKVTPLNTHAVIFDFLYGFIDRTYNGQRVTVATCYAVFVNFAIPHSKSIEVEETNTTSEFDVHKWRSSLIEELTKMLVDSDDKVRKMAIRGICNLFSVYLNCCVNIDQYITPSLLTTETNSNVDIIEYERESTKQKLKDEIISSYISTSIVNNLIEKLSDTSETVALESLTTLQQIVEFLSIKIVIPCISNLLLKVRDCFEHPSFNIRALGFGVFNRVISLLCVNEDDEHNEFNSNYMLDAKTAEIIKEQIQVNLISLMLHSVDDTINVANSSLKCLLKALIVISNLDFKDVYEDKKRNSNNNTYEAFMQFIEIVIDNLTPLYSEKIVYHINNCLAHSLSNQDNIRGYSIYLVGLFLKYTAIHKVNVHIGKEDVYATVSKLLQDNSVKVKDLAMKAMKYCT